MKFGIVGRTLAGASILAIVACSSATSPSTSEPSESADLGTTHEALASTQPNWSGWGTLGGGLTTDPALVSYDATHVGAFATNGNLYFNWFRVLTWDGWVNLGNNGNALSAPPVAVRVGNHIEVFVVDSTSGYLLHKQGTFNGTAEPSWSGWEVITRLSTDPSTGGLMDGGKLSTMGRPPTVVVSQPNNQISIFAKFDDGVPRVLTGSGMGSWGIWTNLGGATPYEPAAVSWGPNRLDTFVTGTDARVYHKYSTDNGVSWNPANWDNVGGNSASAPSVVSWGSNRLDVFVSGRRSGEITGVQHLAWTGGSWGTCGAPPCWDSMHLLAYQDGTNGPMAAPVAITTGVGAINVFVQGIDQGLQTMAMTNANPPTWGGFEEMATCFKTGGTPAVVSSDNQNLQLVMTGYAPNGDAAVYANGTFAGQFTAVAEVQPPLCGCGYPGGTCCWPDNGCNDGAACGSSHTCGCDAKHVPGTVDGQPVCIVAGPVGSPCYSNGTCDPGDIVCDANKCVATGTLGLRCNTGAGRPACSDGSHCAPQGDGNYCQPTGGLGNWCGDQGQCNGGLACDKTTDKCAPSGAETQLCNQDGSCNPGLACNKSTDRCEKAGGETQLCKPDGSCNTGALLCLPETGHCARCADPNGICCAGNTVSYGSAPHQQCGAGNTCWGIGTHGVCKPPPPPVQAKDPPGCGVLSAPAAVCCHVRKTPCDSNSVNTGFCDSQDRCSWVPTGSGSAGVCGSTPPVAVNICVTTEWGSEIYTGNWCSDQQASTSYTNWCTSMKTEHGYTQCDVGQPGGACPASKQNKGVGPGGVGVDPSFPPSSGGLQAD